MTEHELMKAKYANTAFSILYEQRPATPPPTEKELAQKSRIKAKNDRHNAMRKAVKKATFDNKTKANWTI